MSEAAKVYTEALAVEKRDGVGSGSEYIAAAVEVGRVTYPQIKAYLDRRVQMNHERAIAFAMRERAAGATLH